MVETSSSLSFFLEFWVFSLSFEFFVEFFNKNPWVFWKFVGFFQNSLKFLYKHYFLSQFGEYRSADTFDTLFLMISVISSRIFSLKNRNENLRYLEFWKRPWVSKKAWVFAPWVFQKRTKKSLPFNAFKKHCKCRNTMLDYMTNRTKALCTEISLSTAFRIQKISVVQFFLYLKSRADASSKSDKTDRERRSGQYSACAEKCTTNF